MVYLPVGNITESVFRVNGVTNSTQLHYLCLSFVLALTTGCALVSDRRSSRPPIFAAYGEADYYMQCPAAAEFNYAAAMQAESDNSDACVDFYFQSAMCCWQSMEVNLTGQGVVSPRTADLYRSSVSKLLITSQRYRRWVPGVGIQVNAAGGLAVLSIEPRGFAWKSSEFQHVELVGDFDDDNLTRRFRSEGIGVPLVVTRNTNCPQPFTQKTQPFAATAILRCSSGRACIEFSNPLEYDNTRLANYRVPLAREPSAPFSYSNSDDDSLWITNFLRPDTDGSQNRLFMIEPYQRGKIPVVFVHGLLSDPKTWVDLVNEIRIRPDLKDRYQWWAYRYATGGPFLESAADLRRQLKQIRNIYDPNCTDPAMSQIVLIGHSMGGLISKLQVTESGDHLWYSVASRPLSSVRTTAEVRQRLRGGFYFSPSSDVARVVYIGTPHQGSAWARRPIGRIASAMVRPSEISSAQFQQLVSDNPNLLRGVRSDRFPTSIDLMEPDNPILRAMGKLPYSPRVAVHSIVGVARSTWNGEASDGIVPVSSAQLHGVRTERQVDAKHTQLHRDKDTIDEIACILLQHAG